MAVKARDATTLLRVDDGVDVASVTRYYQLAASTASAPAKPTTNPPASAWTSKEPGYDGTTASTLYFTDLTVLSDGAFSYSDVSKSSAYEAAKQAYNKADNAQAGVKAVSTLIRETADGVEVGKSADGKTYSGTHTLNSSDGFYVYGEDGAAMTQIKPGEVVSGAETSTHTHVKSDGFHIYDGAEGELAKFIRDDDSGDLLIQGDGGVLIKHEGSSASRLSDGSTVTTQSTSTIGSGKDGAWTISQTGETAVGSGTVKNYSTIKTSGYGSAGEVGISSRYWASGMAHVGGWAFRINPIGAFLGQDDTVQYGLHFNESCVYPWFGLVLYDLGNPHEDETRKFNHVYAQSIGDSSFPATNGYFTNLYLSGTNYATNIKQAVSESLYSNSTGSTSVTLSTAITSFNYLMVCIKNAQGAHHWVVAKAEAGDCPFETHGVTDGTMWVVFGTLNLAAKAVRLTSQVNMPISGWVFGSGTSNIDCRIVAVRGCY